MRRNGWPIAAAVASLVITVQAFRDTDVWWHLAMGRHILAGGIPAQEPFSFLHAANPWVGQQWLYEVVLARLVDLGSPGLASLAMGLLASAALLVAVLSIEPGQRPAGPWQAASLVLGALVAGQVLGVRGQVVTLFGTATVLYVIRRWRGGEGRWLLLLPPLFVLWANLHAGFIVGLGVGMLALVLVRDVPSRERSLLAGALAIAAVATLANPAGAGLWGYVAATFTNPTLTGLVAEWQSPDFHNVWLRVFEGTALLLALCWFAAPRRDRFDVVLAAATILASLQAQRNVSLFAVVAAPQLARYGAAAWAAHRGRVGRLRRPALTGARPPRWFAPLVTAVVVVATAAAVAPRVTRAAAADYEAAHLPMATATFVGRQLPGRRIYTPDTWGGYLAERFPNGRVVYIYDETEVFGEKALQQYLDVHDIRAGWPRVFADNQITVAILPAAAQETSALLSIGWTVACGDRASQSVVMTRGPATASGSSAEIARAPPCG